MKTWGNKPYYSLDQYNKDTFGEKVYKISLNANLTCPNRDGTLDSRGCLFCSEGGSGEFTAKDLSITEQINTGIINLQKKYRGSKFIAYFQAFTNTYGPISYLREIFFEAIQHPNIVSISIATRPDCLSPQVLDLLSEINHIKPCTVELGLQTIHEKTARFIRRGYPLTTFDQAVKDLQKLSISIVVHLIIGLPSESPEDILNSVQYLVRSNINGVKLQLLHIIKNTDLATYYNQSPFPVLSLEDYVDLLIDCIEILPHSIVVHRITGDGMKELLIEPKWSLHKRKVLNTIHQRFKERKTYQGRLNCDIIYTEKN